MLYKVHPVIGPFRVCPYLLKRSNNDINSLMAISSMLYPLFQYVFILKLT